MAHHESEISEEMKKRLSELSVELKKREVEQYMQRLGATGKFPDGRLTSTDEGELCLAVVVYKGRVVVEFGKPITSLGMTPKEARGLAELLNVKAEEAELVE